MTILTEQNQTVKIRPNLWQLPSGAVVGYGALSSPNGLYYCFTCNVADCQHSRTIEARWLSGEESAEEIPFDGSMPDDDELLFASSADLFPDDYGIEEPTL